MESPPVTEEELQKFYKQCGELSDQMLDFFLDKGKSPAMIIFSSMTVMASIAVQTKVSKDNFVGLAANKWDKWNEAFQEE